MVQRRRTYAGDTVRPIAGARKGKSNGYVDPETLRRCCVCGKEYAIGTMRKDGVCKIDSRYVDPVNVYKYKGR